MRDREVNKFCLFLQRAINKSSYPDVVNSRALFSYSYMLEKIGDEVERLWRTNIKNKIKKTKEFKEIFLGLLTLKNLRAAIFKGIIYLEVWESKPHFKIRRSMLEPVPESALICFMEVSDENSWSAHSSLSREYCFSAICSPFALIFIVLPNWLPHEQYSKPEFSFHKFEFSQHPKPARSRTN